MAPRAPSRTSAFICSVKRLLVKSLRKTSCANVKRHHNLQKYRQFIFNQIPTLLKAKKNALNNCKRVSFPASRQQWTSANKEQTLTGLRVTGEWHGDHSPLTWTHPSSLQWHTKDRSNTIIRVDTDGRNFEHLSSQTSRLCCVCNILHLSTVYRLSTWKLRLTNSLQGHRYKIKSLALILSAVRMLQPHTLLVTTCA